MCASCADFRVLVARPDCLQVKFKMMQQLPVLSGIDLKDPGLKMEAFMEQWAGNLDTPWQLRQVMATLIPRLAGDFVRWVLFSLPLAHHLIALPL